MFQFLRGIALVAALTVTGEMAFAQNGATSANYIVPDCRASIGPALRQGRCSGIVEGFVFAGKDVCAPRAATTEQAVRIVVQYIDKIPERQHEDFRKLAVEALRAAWPCRN
jgi:Rap1a immunity proteins